MSPLSLLSTINQLKKIYVYIKIKSPLKRFNKRTEVPLIFYYSPLPCPFKWNARDIIYLLHNFMYTYSLSVCFMDTRILISENRKISKIGQKHLNINYSTILFQVYKKWCNNSPPGKWCIWCQLFFCKPSNVKANVQDVWEALSTHHNL